MPDWTGGSVEALRYCVFALILGVLAIIAGTTKDMLIGEKGGRHHVRRSTSRKAVITTHLFYFLLWVFIYKL